MKGAKIRRGFTIIEVTLVVSLTALMFVGLVAGIQGTLRRQRYNDSVVSTQDALMAQYNLVMNVQNSRGSEGVTCQERDGALVPESGPYAAGMASDCLVYGRVIEFTHDGTNGTSLRVSNVIGRDLATNIDYTFSGEAQAFADAMVTREQNLTGGAAVAEIVPLPWRAGLFNPATAAANPRQEATGGLILLRSAFSGTVWTYVFTGDVPNNGALSQFISQQTTGRRDLCILSDDASAEQRRALIVGNVGPITAGSNASAVQLAPQDVEVNGLKPVDCRW